MNPVYKVNVLQSAAGTAISYPLEASNGPEPRTLWAMISEVELLCKLLVPVEADDDFDWQLLLLQGSAAGPRACRRLRLS